MTHAALVTWGYRLSFSSEKKAQVHIRKLTRIGWEFPVQDTGWSWTHKNHIHYFNISWFESSNNLTVRRIWHEIRRLTTLITSCHASWVWKLFYFSTKTNMRHRSIILVLNEFYSTIKFQSHCADIFDANKTRIWHYNNPFHVNLAVTAPILDWRAIKRPFKLVHSVRRCLV